MNSPAASKREKVKIIEKGLLKNEKERYGKSGEIIPFRGWFSSFNKLPLVKYVGPVTECNLQRALIRETSWKNEQKKRKEKKIQSDEIKLGRGDCH